MSSSARQLSSGERRPGSSNKKLPAASNRPGSSRKTEPDLDFRNNKSNSATVPVRRQPLQSDSGKQPSKADDGKIKILGQNAELTETEIWNMNDMSSGKTTPISSRNGTFRTPTPSKQISLQAVKRKEDKNEPLETIDWNDFVRPITREEDQSDSMLDDRIPTPELTDSEESDIDSSITMEERLQLVTRRAQEMTSALSSHPLDDIEMNLSKELEKVELEREERDRLEKQRQENEIVRNKDRQNNENFRDFGPKSPRCLDTDTIIVGANSQRGSVKLNSMTVLESKTVKVPDQGTGFKDFAVGARPKELKQNQSSEKKTETVEEIVDDTEAGSSETKSNTVEESSSSDDDEDNDDDNDLIGRKGKAPNELLMEFLDCIMKEEFTTAEKLCRMILIYEPNNEEALSFYPLIQEKIKQEEEAEEEDTDSDSGSDDDDDDDDDNDEDDDDDDDEEEEDSSEEEDDRVLDSGIVSAANSD